MNGREALAALLTELYGDAATEFLTQNAAQLQALTEDKRYYEIPLEDIKAGDSVEYWKDRSERGRSGHGWRRVERVHRGRKHQYVCVSKGKILSGTERVGFDRIIKGLRDV